MASGLGRAHHHKRGRTATEDMVVVHKIEDRPASIDIIEVVMTDAHLTNTDLLHRHQENDGLTGVTVLMLAIATFPHHLLTADIKYHPSLDRNRERDNDIYRRR